jgi:hypothetical protein
MEPNPSRLRRGALEELDRHGLRQSPRQHIVIVALLQRLDDL